ncbi:hypothetical protein MWU63_08975 [Pseudohalocynthiibacter sp. F2068]|nr:hypothetical protein [Pseudohalocynthiibacter sp. F2068]
MSDIHDCLVRGTSSAPRSASEYSTDGVDAGFTSLITTPLGSSSLNLRVSLNWHLPISIPQVF